MKIAKPFESVVHVWNMKWMKFIVDHNTESYRISKNLFYTIIKTYNYKKYILKDEYTRLSNFHKSTS